MKHMFTVCAEEPFPYRGANLRPATDEALVWIRRMNPGDLIECDVVRPRSQQHHKLFFALLKIVTDNQDVIKSTDELLDMIKIGVGHTNTLYVPGMGFCTIPRSISFSSLDQDAFSAFFTKAVDYVIEFILPGIGEEALTAEVFEMAGIGGCLSNENL